MTQADTMEVLFQAARRSGNRVDIPAHVVHQRTYAVLFQQEQIVLQDGSVWLKPGTAKRPAV